ncbi:arginase [Desulfuromonas versatilis]|uniref:Arginase n=1 Tax=Desulfuromonas versatilis TaxID=2802975 RepID=A0ABN6DV55_9BACT|nr:arginase [Desulfuromonas versatilis]BCR03876.1 arginase [Desulfuromonas versatilis]
MKGQVQIIGVPMDLGQLHRGVDMGPGAIRYAGLLGRLARLGYQVHDRGNLPVPVRDSLADQQEQNYLPAIRQVCEATYRSGREALEQGAIPVFLGGDHSIAIGSIGGVTHSAPAGVIWIDAHGDFNTPQTSDSGNIHGMPLAVLLGEGFPELVDVGRPGAKLVPGDVVLIGIRDLDPAERSRLKQSGIGVFTMRDIDERGMAVVLKEALKKLGHRQRLHVSLDVDALEPHEAPGVGTPSPGGLTYREAQLVMEILADTRRVASLDIVEINPILDDRNQTAQIAVALAASLFGKRIL